MKARDGKANKNLHAAFWGVRNDNNLGSNQFRAINIPCLTHIGCSVISDSGFVTTPGLSPSCAALLGRSEKQNGVNIEG